MNHFHTLLIVCPLVFFAGLVDSIAGGGGLLSLPAYYVTGIDPHVANFTNKFSSASGTSFSVYKFAKSKKINYKVSIISAFFSFFGSFASAQMMSMVNSDRLRMIMVIVIPIVAIVVLRVKNFGEVKKEVNWSKEKLFALSALTGVVMGAYDGFIGPGTGTFLILIYTGLFGFDLITASGSAKIVNLSSNLAALSVGLIHGDVLFALAIPAALCSICGSLIGSGLAIKKGAKVIKPVFIFVLVILLITIVRDVFH